MSAFLKDKIVYIFLVFFSLLILIPLWMVFSGSLMGANEVSDSLSPVLSGTKGFAFWPVIPKYPTLRPYVELLMDQPEFFKMFWNSCGQVLPVLAGQLLIAVPAAWGFAIFHFRFKKLLFVLYITLMIMPFQVTMVSSYLVLDRLKLLNTLYAVVIPAIFSTFPVFIMTKFFSSIHPELLEAARMDGANEYQLFTLIGIPLGISGIMSCLVLVFLENWNAIEAPLTFLSDKTLWPLSLYLPSITEEKAGVSLVASVIMMAPALLIFFFGQSYLEQGIQVSGLKG